MAVFTRYTPETNLCPESPIILPLDCPCGADQQYILPPLALPRTSCESLGSPPSYAYSSKSKLVVRLPLPIRPLLLNQSLIKQEACSALALIFNH